MTQTTLVVPCYNEAERLDVAALETFVTGCPQVRYVFVDDGSSDATAGVITELTDRRPDQCKLIRLDRNCGKAEAIRCGVLAALQQQPTFFGYWDADLATPLDAVADMLAVFDAQPAAQMVLGSRVKLMGRDIRRQAVRHYVGRIFATLASMTLDLPIYDTQCGAKLFRATPVTAALFDRPFCTRWVFDVELIARYLSAMHAADPAFCAHRTIYEWPLDQWHDIGGSKVRPADFFKAMLDLIKIRRRYGRRRPTP